MNSMQGSEEQAAVLELTRLLTNIDAHACRTNELLYAMLNREQRQAFDAALAAKAASAGSAAERR